MNRKRLIRLLTLVVIGIAINTPTLKANYYIEGKGMTTKTYSLVTSVVSDFQEGQFLTPQIIKENVWR